MNRRRKLVLLAGPLGVAMVAIALTKHTLRLHVAAWQLGKAYAHAEKVNGVRPIFTTRPSGWFSTLEQDMTAIWAPLKIEGMNYYTLGGPRNVLARHVERSQPSSRFYQAWFGVYVIRGSFAFHENTVDVDRLSELATLDQRQWLRAMGDPKPVAEWMDLKPMGTIAVGAHAYPAYEGTMSTPQRPGYRRKGHASGGAWYSDTCRMGV